MMADDSNAGELCLPSEFLADDFFLDKESGKGDEDCCFPSEFPYELGYESNLSSPVGSITGTEGSDDEGYMAGLTLQMAHYFLQDDEKGPLPERAADGPKEMVTVGSPQSTLCAVSTLNASSRESPNGPSLVSSPPLNPLEPYKDDAWDLLYAAAGQVMRMRFSDESGDEHRKQNFGRGLLAPPQKKTTPGVPVATVQSAASSYANISHAQHQLRVNQFHQLKQQQMMKQQDAAAWGRHGRVKGGVTGGGSIGGGRPARPLGLSGAAWPPIQQPARSGMRAVFLNPASRTESCGTGVFLPRRVDNPTELRKKPACSTVLLPARVVQALNLDLDDLGAHPRRFVLDRDAVMLRANVVVPPKRTYGHQPPPANHHRQHQKPQQREEIRLPSEWTY